MATSTNATALVLACETHFQELRRWVTDRFGGVYPGDIDQARRTVAAAGGEHIIWNGSQDGNPDFSALHRTQQPAKFKPPG